MVWKIFAAAGAPVTRRVRWKTARLSVRQHSVAAGPRGIFQPLRYTLAGRICRMDHESCGRVIGAPFHCKLLGISETDAQ
jgi:hypothetical protein